MQVSTRRIDQDACLFHDLGLFGQMADLCSLRMIHGIQIISTPGSMRSARSTVRSIYDTHTCFMGGIYVTRLLHSCLAWWNMQRRLFHAHLPGGIYRTWAAWPRFCAERSLSPAWSSTRCLGGICTTQILHAHFPGWETYEDTAVLAHNFFFRGVVCMFTSLFFFCRITTSRYRLRRQCNPSNTHRHNNRHIW